MARSLKRIPEHERHDYVILRKEAGCPIHGFIPNCDEHRAVALFRADQKYMPPRILLRIGNKGRLYYVDQGRK